MTAPYVTGTVSVTAGSAVVTGNSTAWQTGLVIGGLFGLDSANGNPVPILSIESDTQLTLAKPWRGTTAANQAYWIVRDTAYGQQLVANAQALATYIQRLDNPALASLAGLTPAADRMPYFNGAGSAALATLSAFARTLLDDPSATTFYATLGQIPNAQLPGRLQQNTGANVVADANDAVDSGEYWVGGDALNIPIAASGQIVVWSSFSFAKSQIFVRLNTGQLWYRAMTAAGTFTAWKPFLFRDEILAAVSQSGGIPTGGIMDRGSNANGWYFRFANGVMICVSNNIPLACDTAAGPIFVSTDTPWNLPGAFVDGNFSVNMSIKTGQRWTSGRPTSTTQAYVRHWAHLTQSTIVDGYAIAIGRWF